MQLHPAVAFVVALIGGAVGGLIGAFLALPIGAILLAVASTIVRRHEVVEDELTRETTRPHAKRARTEEQSISSRPSVGRVSRRVRRGVGSNLMLQPHDSGRWRRVVAGILVVLASLGIALSTVGAWARRAVTNGDRYVSIVGPLIEDPAIQQALATRITDAIFDAVDFQSVVADALPPRVRPLTGPVVNALRGYVVDRTTAVLDSEAASRLWVSANRFAHDEIISLLSGDTVSVTVAGGEVRLNLLALIDGVLSVIEQQSSGLLGRPVSLPSAEELAAQAPDAARARLEEALGVTLPEDFGSVVVLRSNALESAQTAFRLAERAVALLVLVTLILICGALLVSVNRRRTLAQLGLGSFLALLIVRRLAFRVEDDIVGLIPPRSEAAARTLVDAFIQDLRAFTTPLFVIAALVAIGAFAWGRREWIAGRAAAIGRATPGVVRPEWTSWLVAHADSVRIGGLAIAAMALLLLDLTVLNVILVGAVAAGAELLLRRLEHSAGSETG